MPVIRQARKQRTYEPIPRSKKRNLKLWAKGARETILAPHIAGYTDALERGWRAERDYLEDVCLEYHARIDWRITDGEEPELPLPEWDKFKLPEREELSPERMTEKRTRIEEVNARIARWLKYRARRLSRPAIMDARRDPFAILMAKLAGINAPPKARQAFQQYMHEAYEAEIAPTVEVRWNAERTNMDGVGGVATANGPNAPFRARVARELFSELSEEEQGQLKERARAEAVEAKTTYEKAMKSPPSRKPEDRQKCIDNLGKFMAPILRGVQEYTGLHSVAIFGGPMPKYNGELQTLHVAQGRSHGAVQASMPQWAKNRWTRDVMGLMKEYLEASFTSVEQSEAALPQDRGGPSDLAGAQYSFHDPEEVPDDSDEESGEDSDEEDSDSDSENTTSEAEEDEVAKTKKNAKGKGKKKEKEKEREREKRRKEKKQKLKAAAKDKAVAAAMGPGKKRKQPPTDEANKAGKKRVKASTPSVVEDDDEDIAAPSRHGSPTYFERREANIARNKADLAAIDARMAAEGVRFSEGGIPEESGATTVRRKRPRKDVSVAVAPAVPPRRSKRTKVVTPGEVASEQDTSVHGNEGMGVDAPTVLPTTSPALEDGPMDVDHSGDSVPPGKKTTVAAASTTGVIAESTAAVETSAPTLPTESSSGQPSVAVRFALSERFVPGGRAYTAPLSFPPPGPPPSGEARATGLWPGWAGRGRVGAPGLPLLGQATPQLQLSSLNQLSQMLRNKTSPGDKLVDVSGESSSAEPSGGSGTTASGSRTEDTNTTPAGSPPTTSPPPQSPPESQPSLPPPDSQPSPPPLQAPAAPPEPAWTLATAPACPQGAPQWFEQAYEVVVVENLLPCFNELLDRFIEVEAGYNFSKSGKYLDTGVRPPIIGTWIGAGRGRRGGISAKGAVFTPGSTAVDAFGDLVWTWWISLQPAWRKPTGENKALPRSQEKRDATVRADWAKLRVPGPNGVFMIVLALYWWGRGLGEEIRMRERWEATVADVKFMFDGLIALQRREDKEKVVGDTDMESDQLRSASE